VAPGASVADFDVEEWDGAAEVAADSPEEMVKEWGKHPYMKDVILVDEERFLVSQATEHFKLVPAGTVQGDRKVFIEDGKPVVDYEVGLKAWKEWEATAAST
jgi:hypothetical protein